MAVADNFALKEMRLFSCKFMDTRAFLNGGAAILRLYFDTTRTGPSSGTVHCLPLVILLLSTKPVHIEMSFGCST